MASHSRTKQRVPRRHTQSTYKRCNHFKEVLLRIQGKEMVKISFDEVELVRAEITRRQLCMEDVDALVIRRILKFLGMQAYYNNVYYIMKQLTGQPLVTLQREHCRLLFQMFMAIQAPFAKHAPRRANMMSYYYIIKKLCEIRGWDDVSAALPHLKSTSKVIQQDLIWQKICASVGYPFYRSIL